MYNEEASISIMISVIPKSYARCSILFNKYFPLPIPDVSIVSHFCKSLINNIVGTALFITNSIHLLSSIFSTKIFICESPVTRILNNSLGKYEFIRRVIDSNSSSILINNYNIYF